VPATPENALVSAVTAAWMHATTPANSRDVAHSPGLGVQRVLDRDPAPEPFLLVKGVLSDLKHDGRFGQTRNLTGP
jgi:hypothetical protein